MVTDPIYQPHMTRDGIIYDVKGSVQNVHPVVLPLGLT